MTDKPKPKPKTYRMRYRVVATHILGSAEYGYAVNLREVRELENYFRRNGCDGLRVEKFVEGIGYVLHE